MSSALTTFQHFKNTNPLALSIVAGGIDPNVNTRLSTILNRAKANNMSKDSIENAMKKVKPTQPELPNRVDWYLLM